MSYDGAVIEQYTQGINAPGVSQDGYVALARVTNVAGELIPNLAYERMRDVLLPRIHIRVTPTFSSSNQNDRVSQGAKGAASIADITCTQAERFSIRRGTDLALTAADAGPIVWHGTGGALALLRCTFVGVLRNVSLNASNPFYFGWKTGGSVPQSPQVVYLNSTHDARQTVHVSAEIWCVNANQPASIVWPVFSGADAVTAGQIQWTDMLISVEDTGLRTG